MFAIGTQELKRQLKSIKSIIVILIIFSATLGAAYCVNKFASFINGGPTSDNYTSGLMICTIILGPLFAFTLSHNAINEEIKMRTIRFIVTKTSRVQIILGKYLGFIGFWLFSLIISILFIAIFAHNLYIHKMLCCFSFILYYVGLAMLLSTMIKNPITTNLLGISLSILMTIVGFWSLLSHNIFLKLFSYITPYHYLIYEYQSPLAYTPVLFSIVFVAISILILRKRDL